MLSVTCTEHGHVAHVHDYYTGKEYEDRHHLLMNCYAYVRIR